MHEEGAVTTDGHTRSIGRGELRAAIEARRPYLINANIGADQNPGGAGVWELPGLGRSQPAFGGRYQP
jgi:acetolactate synthase-1/2/3 large subunit